MITLPTEASKPQIVNARRMVLFAQTKAGKTEAVSQLQNALLIDGEDGSGYVGGMKINIKEECRKNQTNPLAVLQEIGKALNDYYKQNGKYPYDYLIMDTATSLEEFARSYATFMYKQTPIGKSFAGADVVAELPNGGGYDWLRKAFEELLKPIKDKCNKCFILTGHAKNSSINKNGKDLNAKDLALTGKLKLIVCADADAIGYMYRNPTNNNQTILSFKTHEQDLATGARPSHLANQEFVICELTNPDYSQKKEEKKFITHWDKIFI